MIAQLVNRKIKSLITTRKTVFVLAGLIVIFASEISFGQDIGIYTDRSGADAYCEVNPAGAFIELFVVVEPSHGVRSVRFAVPVPECMSSNDWYLMGEIVGPGVMASGNSQSGMIATFDSCVTSPIVVLTLQFMYLGFYPTTDCCFEVVADSSAQSGLVEFTDCDLNTIWRHGGYAVIDEPGNCPTPTGWDPPSNPTPPDSAVDISTNVALKWYSTLPMACPPIVGHTLVHDIYFGTSPDPPLVIQYIYPQSYNPGPLQPNTTYYWRIRPRSYMSIGVLGPVWRFTTQEVSPVKPTSWGDIKSKYKK